MKQKVREKLTVILSAFLILVAGIISVATAQASSLDSRIASNFFIKTRAFISDPFASLPKIINGGTNIISISPLSAADKIGASNVNPNSSNLSGKKITNSRIVNPINSIGAFFSSLPNIIYQQLVRATADISIALVPFLSESRSNIIVYKPPAALSVNKIITSPALASQLAAVNSENSFNNQSSSSNQKTNSTNTRLVSVSTSQETNNVKSPPKASVSNTKYATPSDLAELEIRVLAAIEKAKQEVSTNANSVFYNWAATQSLTHLNTPSGGGGITIGGSSWPSSSGSAGQVLSTDGSGSLAWSSSASSGGTANSGSIGQISYFAAAGTTVSGTSSLIIDTDQDIGIGTTSPWADLSVNSLPLTGGTVPVFVVATSTSGYVTSTVLIVSANGLVGLGTSSPATSFSLSVNGPLYVAGNNLGGNSTSTFGTGINVRSINTTGTATSTFANGIILSAGCIYSTASGACVSGAGAGTVNSGTQGQIAWYSQAGSNASVYGTSTITILATTTTSLPWGTVGIGTTTPNWNLQIAGVSPKLTLTDTAAVSGAKHWWLNNANGDFQIGTTSDNLATSNTLITIASTTGYVGIGTAAPGYTLHVVGAAYANRVYGNGGVGSVTDNVFGFAGDIDTGIFANPANTLTFTTGGTARIFVGTTGLVGIGTTTPNWNLQIASSSKTFLTLSDMSTSAAANQRHWFLSSMGGNLYIGTSSDSYATGTISAITINTNGYLGIGSSSPSQQLSLGGLLYVGGTATSTFAGVLAVGTSTPGGNTMFEIGTSSPLLVVDKSTGNVGIGTAMPLALTQIGPGADTPSGGTAASRMLYVSTNGQTDLVVRDSQNNIEGRFTAVTTGSPFPAGIVIGTQSNHNLTLVTNNTAKLLIDSNGLVGIGTTTPNWILQVATTSSPTLLQGAALTLSDTGANANQKHWFLSSMGGNFYIGTSSDSYATNTISALTILNNDNVGIGTSSPFAEFSLHEINGPVTTPLFAIASSTWGVTPTTTLFIINPFGRVGIGGTSTPTATLSVTGTSTAPVFMVSTSTSQTIFMIDQNGNIGIGTSTPSLNGTNGGINLVLGSGNASSSLIIPRGAICVDADGGCIATSTGFVSALGFYASASDVAEQYKSDEQLQAGDIVMIKDNQLVGKANKALEGRVIGVVSEKPGLRLGPSYELDGPQAMTDQYPIALVGRVLINVSNEGGEIAVGDKITISSLDGIGMKSTDSFDSIVGIALQPFDSDLAGETARVNGSEVKIGKILIFVNLNYARILSQQATQKNLTLNSNGGVEGIGVINSQDLIQSVRDILAALGAVIENGVAKIQKLIVGIIETQELKVGSPEKPSGVTIYDRSTGKPYCVYVENGQLQTVAGECSQINQNNQNINSIGEQPAISPAPNQPTQTVEPSASNSPQPAETIEPSPSSEVETSPQPSSEATATTSPAPVTSEPPTIEQSQPSPSEPSQPSDSPDQSTDNSSPPTI